MMRVPRTLLAGTTALALVAALGSAATAQPTDDVDSGGRSFSAPATPDADGPSGGAVAPGDLRGALSGPAAQTFAAVNDKRANAGVAALRDDAALDVLAQGWADHLAAIGDIEENPTLTKDLPAGWIEGGELWGALATSDGADALIASLLLNSGLVVNPAMTHIGTGYALGADGNSYAYLIVVQYPARDIGLGDPFTQDIWWMYQTHVTTGYPDGTFRPLGSVTREAMAAFLYRAQSNEPIPACDPAAPRVFTDVTAAHPFCGAIEWLAKQGISTGWPDHTYRPGEPVSREAMAAFLYRLANLVKGVPNTPLTCDPTTARAFVDVTAAHPFCGAIEWLAAKQISTGWPDHTFRPGIAIERQAMAAFLDRYASVALS